VKSQFRAFLVVSTFALHIADQPKELKTFCRDEHLGKIRKQLVVGNPSATDPRRPFLASLFVEYPNTG
jgi:hypothetical protein